VSHLNVIKNKIVLPVVSLIMFVPAVYKITKLKEVNVLQSVTKIVLVVTSQEFVPYV